MGLIANVMAAAFLTVLIGGLAIIGLVWVAGKMMNAWAKFLFPWAYK